MTGDRTGGVVERLQRMLGTRLATYLCSVPGDGPAGAELGLRLEVAEQAAVIVAGVHAPSVVQAWFQGMNPLLADRAPAHVLAEGPVTEWATAVLDAARAFIVGATGQNRLPAAKIG